MAQYTIYGLLDPLTNELFYIGQTFHYPKYRLINHLCSLESKNTPVYQRIKSILSNGVKPTITSLFEFESDLKEYNANLTIEKIFIEEYSYLGTLVNKIHNPLYDKKLKVFIEPKTKKVLKCQDGKYFIDSPIIRGLHTPTYRVTNYNPYNNPLWMKKMGLTS